MEWLMDCSWHFCHRDVIVWFMHFHFHLVSFVLWIEACFVFCRPCPQLDVAPVYDVNVFSSEYVAPLQYITWRKMFKSLKPGNIPRWRISLSWIFVLSHYGRVRYYYWSGSCSNCVTVPLTLFHCMKQLYNIREAVFTLISFFTPKALHR